MSEPGRALFFRIVRRWPNLLTSKALDAGKPKNLIADSARLN